MHVINFWKHADARKKNRILTKLDENILKGIKILIFLQSFEPAAMYSH